MTLLSLLVVLSTSVSFATPTVIKLKDGSERDLSYCNATVKGGTNKDQQDVLVLMVQNNCDVLKIKGETLNVDVSRYDQFTRTIITLKKGASTDIEYGRKVDGHIMGEALSLSL
jgi:hypothetical protein